MKYVLFLKCELSFGEYLTQLWKLAVLVYSACQNHDNICKNRVFLLPSCLVALTLFRGLSHLQTQLPSTVRQLQLV